MSARQNLAHLAAERGHSLSALSARIGRNATYLQRFIACGSPKRLDPTDRLHLAKVLQVDERLLGARDPWSPAG